ncbi:YraN family protein [Noviherbaspirillum galbum]|uniref:UPF0102 protein G3574_22570 n=1 Tax=Noviherbaspirillum galbum TaxID=2709383 RepID=A0A6B3ST84_9BURK|nr:YraN family protein [Noviherbaspirillum galbum]NEX63874.1 YraN family protein [Noviherbaspirillum galbum]
MAWFRKVLQRATDATGAKSATAATAATSNEATPGDEPKPSRTPQQRAGQAAEEAALRHLLSQGMRLEQRNFLCKGGEIDLIMWQDATLVFVEVRKRANGRFGGALASIGAQKQRRLILAAELFLQRFRHAPPCRFDIIAIDDGKLSWVRDAIQA